MATSPAQARAQQPPRPQAHAPSPPNERGAWLVAIALGTLGVLALVAALSGVIGGSTPSAPASSTPPVPLAAALPAPAAAVSGGGQGAHRLGVIVGRPSPAQQSTDARRFESSQEALIATRWMEGFYPIYAVAQETFGVNWLLLASIHRQESAFSTAPSTYRGLNFAHCCGGPMQFNVTNGPPSTWQLVSDSYIYGRRPAAYGHMTATHPSIYDDFDSIMAAAHLLSADGAEYRLDGAAWLAAYDYYGHDLTGVTYADQVLARAIGWSQHGFCIDCGVRPGLQEAVHAAYGAPVAQALLSAAAARSRRPEARGARPPRSATGAGRGRARNGAKPALRRPAPAP
jgi:hypothetical protein